MAPKIQDLVIELNFKDAGSQRVINQIRSSLSGLEDRLTTAAPKVASLRKEILAQGKASRNTASNLKLQVSALTALRDEARLGSTTFKQLTADIERLNGQLAKAEGRRKGGGFGGRLRTIGGVSATALGAGIFGGPEGFAGAVAGGILGGIPGAQAGAVGGAAVSQVRQALGATAEYSANLAKLRIALRGVTTSQSEYNEALKFIEESTKRFAIPQEIVTRQFTKLQASVQGAGGGLADTKTAFNGIVASVRATGGSLQDIDSSLTATAQVFSKGKVSAEELRQQIGERLPGAFTLFAKSLDLTPQELDKALEKGQVSLQHFLTFTTDIFEKYGLNAEIIGKSPEAAGDRLAVALSNMQESVGRVLQPIGAAFQEVFTAIVNKITEAADALNNFLGISDDNRISLLSKRITEGNLELARLNADIAREQRQPKPADPFGAQGAFGGGESGLTLERDQLARQIAQMSQELEGLRAMRRLRSDIAKAKPGDGLPGIDKTPPGGLAAKDISKARADELISRLRLQQRGIELTKEEILENSRLARIAAESLDPQKKRVRLVEIEVMEHKLINKLEQDQLRRSNLVSKAKLDFNELLAKAKGEQGLLNEEQVQQELNQIKVNELMLKYNVLVEEGVIKQEDLRKKLEEAVAALNKAQSPLESFRSGLQKVFQEAMNLNEALATAGVQAVQQFGDAFADFVATGKSSFADLTRSILQDLSRIFARAALFKGLSLIPGVGSFLSLPGFADGGVIAKNKIVPFAYGGIVNKPTLFPMANGAGLMGEAGPEAIMPLRRGRDGKLGVEASGGVGNVVVNVDASGSRVQGDQPNAKALGSAIGAAVQAEIVRQKRPGGLLS